MKTQNAIPIIAVATIAIILSGTFATADPLPGQVLKFSQLPQDGVEILGIPYYGHDEASSIYGTRGADPRSFQSENQGIYMADDFSDEFDTPVVHVRWWGSYALDNDPGFDGVQQFLISFEQDVPAFEDPLTGVTIPSHPDFNHDQNLHQIVYKDPDGDLSTGSGTFLEKKITDSTLVPAIEDLYEYNAELAIPFDQEPNKVYWIKIVALIDNPKDGLIRWGWHNRDYTVENTLAVHPPALLPGEDVVGVLGPTTTDPVEIWHFQDDAVQGFVEYVSFPGGTPGGPGADFVGQDPTNTGWWETYYQHPTDGPDEIIQYSKDLAFELYTVPEPSSMMLVCIGMLGLLGLTRRKR